MRALATLAFGAAMLSCANGPSGDGAGGGEGRMATTTTGAAVVRRTTVRIPAEQVGVDLDGRRGFVATQRCAIGDGGKRLVCHLPPLAAGGPHRVAIVDLTSTPAAVTIELGILAEGGAPAVTGASGVMLAGGAALQVEADAALGPPEYVDASWRAPLAAAGPLLRLAKIRGAGRWSVEAYDPSTGARRWKTGASELGGEPVGLAVAPDGAAAYLALRKQGAGAAFELVALDGVAGTMRWRVPLAAPPVGTILPSTDGAEVAVLVRDTARCASCTRLVIASARDGGVVRETALGDGAVAANATSAGFGGDAAWFYRYVPAHRTSELAPAGRTPVPDACAYERYDANAAERPPRTLRDADGEWKEIADGCRVRALLPLAGGRVAAIQVVAERELTVVELDGAP